MTAGSAGLSASKNESGENSKKWKSPGPLRIHGSNPGRLNYSVWRRIRSLDTPLFVDDGTGRGIQEKFVSAMVGVEVE